MASTFPTKKSGEVDLRTRKGHDMTWSCDKHGEPIKFYCKKHKIPICHPCATRHHSQKPCEMDDIEDVIFERRRQQDEKRPKVQELHTQLEVLSTKIKTVSTSGSTHLRTINNNIQASYHDKIKSVGEKENRMIRVINEEADEEIRLVKEKREKRIKDCNIEGEKERQIIKDREAQLLSDAKKIREIVSKKILDLTNKGQHVINTIKNTESTITRINQHDETLVNETPQVLASIDENLSLNVHQDVSDCLDRIQSKVERVKFVEREVGGEYYGRIDGYIGKWELVKSIHIPSSIVNKPWVRGLVSDDEICVKDVGNNDMYVTTINTQHTEKVIGGGVCSTSCAPIDSNVIVFGKRDDCAYNSLDGCITLYDRQWKVIRDISIPRNGVSDCVYVDIDRDGVIIAAQFYQSIIYVINPAKNEIVNTITMQGKKVWGEIQALSSGDIVVKTGYGEYTVISRSGGEDRAVIHCNEWNEPQCRVDKLTDTFYITYLDEARTAYAVDQVSRDGIIKARRIVEYVKSERHYYRSPCLVTPSANLVGCDAEKLLLYKKVIDTNKIKRDGVDTTNTCDINIQVAKAGGKLWSTHKKVDENEETKDGVLQLFVRNAKRSMESYETKIMNPTTNSSVLVGESSSSDTKEYRPPITVAEEQSEKISDTPSTPRMTFLVPWVSLLAWIFPLLILGVMISPATASTQFLATNSTQTLNLIEGTNATINFDRLKCPPPAVPYYTFRYLTEEQPFCCKSQVSHSLMSGGLKEQDQETRFSVEGFHLDDTFSAILNIRNVSVQDGGWIELVYLLLNHNDHVFLRRTAEINVLSQPKKVKCHFLREEASKHHVVRCHAPAENGKVTISCYQNFSRTPPIVVYTDSDDLIRATFLPPLADQVHCCSHLTTKNVTQETCDHSIFRHPEQILSPISSTVLPPVIDDSLHIDRDLSTEGFMPSSSADQAKLSGLTTLYLQIMIAVCSSLFNILT